MLKIYKKIVPSQPLGCCVNRGLCPPEEEFLRVLKTQRVFKTRPFLICLPKGAIETQSLGGAGLVQEIKRPAVLSGSLAFKCSPLISALDLKIAILGGNFLEDGFLFVQRHIDFHAQRRRLFVHLTCEQSV